MLHLPPLTLYVHVPWCVRKCPYCDFNSHEPQGGDIPEAEYLIALERDLASDLPRVQGRKLSAVFFGGGTPSLLSPATIAAILKNAERAIGFEPDIEITLEANPGTFEQDRFRGFRSAGVNRLSIGIQSFDNRHLQRLGRIHDRAAAVTAATRTHTQPDRPTFLLSPVDGIAHRTVVNTIVYRIPHRRIVDRGATCRPQHDRNPAGGRTQPSPSAGQP